MCANNSAAPLKNRQQLLHWGKTDLEGLVDFTLGLQAELRRLQDAAAQNSRNSSLPPSRDRAEQPKPRSLRSRSGRKPGGQPNHPGRTLPFNEHPDQVVIHTLESCPCGRDLSHEPVVDYVRRQV
jgi:hypothetical protein